MDLQQLSDRVNEIIEQAFEEENMQCIDHLYDKWPLDKRAWSNGMHSDGEVLAVPKNYVQRLDYYGGFEYVKDENRVDIGDWVFFSNEHNRVARVLDQLFETNTDQSEDDE